MGSSREECPICFETYADRPFELPCGHAFHAECLLKACLHDAARPHSCPLCRAALGRREEPEAAEAYVEPLDETDPRPLWLRLRSHAPPELVADIGRQIAACARDKKCPASLRLFLRRRNEYRKRLAAVRKNSDAFLKRKLDMTFAEAIRLNNCLCTAETRAVMDVLRYDSGALLQLCQRTKTCRTFLLAKPGFG